MSTWAAARAEDLAFGVERVALPPLRCWWPLPAAVGVDQALEPLLVALRRVERRLQRENGRLRVALGRALQREQRRQLLDLDG